MRINQEYPPPIHGVSTLSPINRKFGQAQEQENFRSDPAAKLTKRPSTDWVNVLVHSIGHKRVKHHEYRRGGDVYEIIITDDGTVYGFVNGEAKMVNNDLASYITAPLNIGIATINDTTFICNRETSVERGVDTDYSDANARKVHHINFVKALNYSERVSVTLKRKSTSATITFFYDAPDLNPAAPAAADEGRGTAYACEELRDALLIELAANPTFPCESAFLGTTLAFWNTADDDWFEVTIETGQGVESVKHFGDSIPRLDGLPKFAVDKTVYKVEPDANSRDGSYYVKSRRIADITDNWPGSLPKMFEVVWEETRSPSEPYGFVETTMPHTIVYDQGTDSFTCGVSPVSWEQRESGDDESNPFPDFTGIPIENLGFFQNRLCILADNTIHLSKTDNLYQWFKGSAVELLVTDPCHIQSNAKGIDGLKHVLNHNRDLMVVAANGQFKIPGDQAVSPQTVSMPMTTAYECQVTVAPVGIGNAVYLPISYGNSSGLSAYTGEPNTSQDSAQPVTTHVAGYMLGTADILAASSNLELLVYKTSGCEPNEFFVLEQARATNGQLQQLAWCKWVLSDITDIINITVNNDIINVICLEGIHIVKKTIQLHSAIATPTSEVYLDDKLTLTSDGNSVTVPVDYDLTDAIVVCGDGTDYPLNTVSYTTIGNILVFEESISSGSCTVYVGRTFRSKYIPTRPFLYDQNTGRPDTKDRLRVNRFILHLTDTHSVSANILTTYNTYPTQTFVSRPIGNILSVLGEKTFFTGDVKMSFSHEASEALIEFFDEGYLNTTISGIGWEGQLYKSSRVI